MFSDSLTRHDGNEREADVATAYGPHGNFTDIFVQMSVKRVVLYGVGSPLVIDAEETCFRANVEIFAAIRNVEGAVYVIDAVRVIASAEVTDAERECDCSSRPVTAAPPSKTRYAWVSRAQQRLSIQRRPWRVRRKSDAVFSSVPAA